MELYILDDKFDTLGKVSVFRTLIWRRRYEKAGSFELTTSAEYFELLAQGRYLYRDDRDELGLLNEPYYLQNEDGTKSASVKGYFAEYLLSDRVIYPMMTLSGTAEAEMRRMVKENAISNRPIGNLSLGDLSGVAGNVSAQITGANLSEKLYEIGNALEISHRIRYDFLTNDLKFEVWQGIDRRDTQEKNSWAIFSSEFYNVKGYKYNKSDTNYKNFAYVAGQGEGSNRTVVTVDLRSSSSEPIKELWVDARDLGKTGSDGKTLTDTQYADLSAADKKTVDNRYASVLRQRGREKLAAYRQVQNITVTADHRANLVYREDFDVGDYSVFRDAQYAKIESYLRITEIHETYEENSESIDITLGYEGVTNVSEIIKRST